jgi:GTP 3',8-cyclase
MEGLKLAAALGFGPVKINCVVLKGINDDEVLNLALLAFEHHFHVRFIELMPTGSKREWQRHYLPMAEVRRRLAVLGEFVEVTPGATAGPARIFRMSGGAGEVGFISPMSDHHCGSCNRLRLTAQGRLRPCLLGEAEFDIKEAIRSDCSDEMLAAIFQEAIRCKNFRPEPWTGTNPSLCRSMAAIGG